MRAAHCDKIVPRSLARLCQPRSNLLLLLFFLAHLLLIHSPSRKGTYVTRAIRSEGTLFLPPLTVFSNVSPIHQACVYKRSSPRTSVNARDDTGPLSPAVPSSPVCVCVRVFARSYVTQNAVLLLFCMRINGAFHSVELKSRPTCVCVYVYMCRHRWTHSLSRINRSCRAMRSFEIAKKEHIYACSVNVFQS